MTDKSITIKFWRIFETEDDQVEFGEALRAAFSKENSEKIRNIDGIQMQLEADASQSGPIFLGDIIRLQGEALPSQVKIGQKAQKLELGDGFYLGHHSGFVFDSASGLLGLEIRPSAAGYSKTVELVSSISECKIGLGYPVLLKKAMDELTNKKNGKFSFKVADPVSLQTADPELATLRDNIVALRDTFDGAYINVSIGVGRRTEGLEEGPLLKVVGWLLGERSSKRGKVRALRVSQPGEDSPLLDFIKAQVHFKETLPLIGIPETDWTLRSDFLKKTLSLAKPHVSRPSI